MLQRIVVHQWMKALLPSTAVHFNSFQRHTSKATGSEFSTSFHDAKKHVEFETFQASSIGNSDPSSLFIAAVNDKAYDANNGNSGSNESGIKQFGCIDGKPHSRPAKDGVVSKRGLQQSNSSNSKFYYSFKKYRRLRKLPTAHTCGFSTLVNENGFICAGCGVFWSSANPCTVSERLKMYPVTLFRAQLQAIIIALKYAVANDYKMITLRTDSFVFLRGLQRQWRRNDGLLIKNHAQFKCILGLTNQLDWVNFQIANTNEDQFIETRALAIAGSMKPMCSALQKLKSQRKVSGRVSTHCKHAHLTSSSAQDGYEPLERICYEISHLSEICRVHNSRYAVHLLKVGGNGRYIHGHIVTDVQAKSVFHTFCKAAILAIDEEQRSGNQRLIISVNSIRFFKSVVEWLPVWRQNGWINSVKKTIANANDWRLLDKLLKTIDIEWRLKDSRR